MPNPKIRTRFAPSPTGYMHVGNLRTALYTYLMAKHDGGTFILRIEDTDQGRYVEGAVDVIYNTLRETGLPFDESLQKKFPYFEGTYEVFDVPHTDFQIRYQPEQILAASGRKILTGTAFLCRRENERCLMLPSRYEKVDVEDFIREHLFFYDDAEMRHVGVALSEVA